MDNTDDLDLQAEIDKLRQEQVRRLNEIRLAERAERKLERKKVIDAKKKQQLTYSRKIAERGTDADGQKCLRYYRPNGEIAMALDGSPLGWVDEKTEGEFLKAMIEEYIALLPKGFLKELIAKYA